MFKLDRTNYKIWNSGNTDPEDIFRQTELAVDPLEPSWDKTPENIIWEMALKEGYSLSSSVEVVDNIKSNKVYKVSDNIIGQHFYIFWTRLSTWQPSRT